MSLSFITLATEVQKELDGERKRLSESESKLGEKASAVAGQLARAEVKTAELTLWEKKLEKQNEEISRREAVIRRDTEASADLQAAMEERKRAEENRRKAEEAFDAARMREEDLAKRELALAERKNLPRGD